MSSPEAVKIYPCPLSTCHFAMLSEPPGPAENDGALADVFGWGVFGAIATAERLQRTERQLAEHLATHSPQEFAIELATANKRIAELEQLQAENEQLRERLRHAAIVMRSSCACPSCKDFYAEVLDAQVVPTTPAAGTS